MVVYNHFLNYIRENCISSIFQKEFLFWIQLLKGNCDAGLVLQAAYDTYENKFDKAVIVSSDGDYTSLIKLIKYRGKLRIILSPHNKNLCSIILKRMNVLISCLNDKKSILQDVKEKTPVKDETLIGFFSW